jgi:hypothetical protein
VNSGNLNLWLMPKREMSEKIKLFSEEYFSFTFIRGFNDCAKFTPYNGGK